MQAPRSLTDTWRLGGHLCLPFTGALPGPLSLAGAPYGRVKQIEEIYKQRLFRSGQNVISLGGEAYLP